MNRSHADNRNCPEQTNLYPPERALPNQSASALFDPGTRDSLGTTNYKAFNNEGSFPRPDFHLTIINSSGLTERLATELRFVVSELKLCWPLLKKDPAGFGTRKLAEGWRLLNRLLKTPNVVASVLTSVCIVFSAVGAVLILGRVAANHRRVRDDESEAEIVTLKLSDEKTPRSRSGVGISSKGRVGFDRNKGEGSEPERRRARGGGGSGKLDHLPAQNGRIPQPSEIPAPIAQLPPFQKQALPLAGIDMDPALWKKLPAPAYGDPRSITTVSSNGPGVGGVMGSGSGYGIGEGNGPGFGPGENGNTGGGKREFGGGGRGSRFSNDTDDSERVFPVSQVLERARVLSKPEPQYTEEARRNQVTGTVVLRVVFSRSGEVTNIRAVSSLPFGLTERAIIAARQIRFLPAIKDGHAVSVYMQLEYNFNLY